VQAKVRVVIHEGLDPAYPYLVTRRRWRSAIARYALGDDVQARFTYDDTALRRALTSADVLVGWKLPLEMVARAGQGLSWIQVTGAGINRFLPLDWLPEGVALTTSSGAQCPTAQSLGMTALLMLNGRLPEILDNQRRGIWGQRFSNPIIGRTVLIVGTGEMGGAIAGGARRLGMRVLGVSRRGRRRAGFASVGRPEDLDDLMPMADVLFLCVPLTAETRGLIGRRKLARLRPGGGLVNFGRAALLDEAALIAALRDGHLGGAVLDGYATEPLPAASPLWTTPRLILLPHVASGEPGVFMDRSVDILCDNIARWRAGRPLRNRVSRQHGY